MKDDGFVSGVFFGGLLMLFVLIISLGIKGDKHDRQIKRMEEAAIERGAAKTVVTYDDGVRKCEFKWNEIKPEKEDNDG